MDQDLAVLDAKLGLSLVAAIGLASTWADRHGVGYRVVGVPAGPSAN
jgi:hypothetical protein